MDGRWGHYAKWNKSGREAEKDKYYMISLICEISKTKQSKIRGGPNEWRGSKGTNFLL